MSTTDLSPAEMLSFSTVRIECETPAGLSTGTGFVFAFFKDEAVHYPVIVTNRHVVAEAQVGSFFCHVTENMALQPPLRHTQVKIPDFEGRWTMHPDPEVDLCAYPMGPLLGFAEHQGRSLYYKSLDRSLLLTEEEMAELQGLEDIVMVGYPNGLWDSHNKMPIMRRGVAATHPRLDYEGRKEFLIDAACFPGSSGSPVFLINQGVFTDRRGMPVFGRRVKLLGVLYAGPHQLTTGEIVMMSMPTSPRPVAISNMPINLGQVIKAERLLDFEAPLRILFDSAEFHDKPRS